MLRHGDRRSTGRADEVASVVLRQPACLPELAAGLWHPDPLVRMRASDALEKVSRYRPQWLRPLGSELLALAATTTEPELQWHLAQLLPRVGLRSRQGQGLVTVLRSYLHAPSVIVRVSALQALVELSGTDRALRPWVRRQVRRALVRGSPAERARARKLLAAGAAVMAGN
jgi:hypothetical protein